VKLKWLIRRFWNGWLLYDSDNLLYAMKEESAREVPLMPQL
jgi:hypothetical protein